MDVSAIKLFQALRQKVGEEESNSIVEFVHTEIDAKMEQKTAIFLTKEDKAELTQKISDTNTKIKEMEINLLDRMNKNKTEILMWIVSTGVLQFLMVLLSKKL
jgi:hypothetical protein